MILSLSKNSNRDTKHRYNRHIMNLVFQSYCTMTKSIQVRVEAKLKHDADLIFEDLGLDTPTAIRLFLKKVVVYKSIPFELKVFQTENGFTPEFEEEVLKASADKKNIGPFYSAKKAISHLHKHRG